MFLGNSSVERDSSFHRNLYFVSARLYGILLCIASTILPARSTGGFGKWENVAGKYGMANACILNSLKLFMLNVPSQVIYQIYFRTGIGRVSLS